MNLQKKSKYIIILFIMLISCFIGFKSLSPSKPNYSDNSKTNVNNQMEHIKNIAQEPHSIDIKEVFKNIKYFFNINYYFNSNILNNYFICTYGLFIQLCINLRCISC